MQKNIGIMSSILDVFWGNPNKNSLFEMIITKEEAENNAPIPSILKKKCAFLAIQLEHIDIDVFIGQIMFSCFKYN